MERGKYLGQMIVATRPCGCSQGWMWSDAFKPKEIAKTTGQWVADGCFIEHLTRYENDGLMKKYPVKCGLHAGTHTDWLRSTDEKPFRNGLYEVSALYNWRDEATPKPILPTGIFSFYSKLYDKWGRLQDIAVYPLRIETYPSTEQAFWWRGLTEVEYQRRIILKNTQTAPVA